MKSSNGIGTKNYSDILGYSANRSPRLYKNGLAGLKVSPRAALANLGTGSDKDSVRSRKTRSRKQLSSPKKDVPLYKKRNLDFTDYAHREAVNRLKFLLAESYSPCANRPHRSSFCHKHDDSDDTDTVSQIIERPVLTEISKYLPTNVPSGRYSSLKKYNSFPTPSAYQSKDVIAPPKPMYAGLNTLHVPGSTNIVHVPLQQQQLQQSHQHHHPTDPNARPPPEILNFIEKQEGYIEQLERESQFCRDELNNLLDKVKDVISENETLTDQARAGVSHPVLQDTSESSECNDGEFTFLPKKKGEKVVLQGPNIVFESRISELEAQLTQASIDYKKLSEENDKHRRLANSGSGVPETGTVDIYKRQVENLQRDKQNLEDAVRKLQHTIDDLKESDAHNFSKTQRSRDLAEQSSFEKAQADIEIKRLKDELERQHVRVREIQHEMAKKVSEERSIAERRYNYQVDQLGGDLSSQWEVASRLQLEVERQKRMENDYRRDLAQKNAQIDELKSELKNKTASLLSDVAQVNAEKQSLEQEITSLRLQLERAERQSKVESSRLNAEIISLRQRLDRSDSDLLHSRRENLRLADSVANLDKELTLGDINRETRPSKEITKLMSDMEAKHVATVSELESMVQGQRQLMEKLTAECKTLTNRLEDTTAKHKTEKDSLRQTNVELMDRLRKIWQRYKESLPPSLLPATSISSPQINHGHTISGTSDTEESSSCGNTYKPVTNTSTTTSTPQKSHHSHLKMHSSSSSNAPAQHQLHTTSYHPPAQPHTTPPTNPDENPYNRSEHQHHSRRQSILDNCPPQPPSPPMPITPPASPKTSTQKTVAHRRSKSQDHHYRHAMTMTSTRMLATPIDDTMVSNQIPYQVRPPPTAMTPSPSTVLVATNPKYMTRTMIPLPLESSSSTSQNMTIHNTPSSHSTIPAMPAAMRTTSNNTIHNSSTINSNLTIPANSSSSSTISILQATSTIQRTTSQPLTTPNHRSQLPLEQQQQQQQQHHQHHHQATQNQNKATEMWGRNIAEQNNGQLPPPAPASSLLPRNYCQNSLPRALSYVNCDEMNEEWMPELSISSPSLFDTSPSSSPTLSPAITVHKLY